MSWSIGYNSKQKRDIGYGVPSICDHPGCNKEINRGLSYMCGDDLYGGEYGCGLYFCEEHLFLHETRKGQFCACCIKDSNHSFTPTPDTLEWINWKMTDESWAQWREENPELVKDYKIKLGEINVNS